MHKDSSVEYCAFECFSLDALIPYLCDHSHAHYAFGIALNCEGRFRCRNRRRPMRERSRQQLPLTPPLI